MAKHYYDDMYQRYMRCKVPYILHVRAEYERRGIRNELYVDYEWSRWTIRGSEKLADYVEKGPRAVNRLLEKSPETGNVGAE